MFIRALDKSLPFFCLLGVLCGPGAHADELDWVKKDRVRAAYGGAGKTAAELETLFDKLRANGFNAYFAKCDFDVSTKEKWDEFASRADAAQRHNIRLFICCNFLGGGIEPKILAGLKLRYTPPEGPRNKTACPLDDAFWQKSVAERALQAAKMSKEHPGLVGFIVDPEMYGADSATYGPPCFCDECFRKYLVSALCTVVAPSIPFAERIPYLKKREGGEQEYSLLQAARVGSIARSIRKQVRAEAPEFLLGWLLFYPGMNWFADAVVEQWADEDIPVLLAPEQSYYTGYTKGFVDDPVEKLKSAGINAIYLPGIGWDSRFPCLEPEHLPAHLFLCATKADGYWVWHVPYGEAKGAEAALVEKYWAAYKLGNEEIAKWSASGGTYQTSLKLIIAPPNPKREVIERFVNSAASFVAAQESAPPVEAPKRSTKLRGMHQMVVLVRPGEGLGFQATAHRLGNLPGPCGYFVFDSTGKELKRGDFDVDRPATVQMPDATPGVYLVALTSRGPTYSITTKNALAAIEAAPLEVCQYSNPLYFFVPKGVQKFTIRIQAEPTSETAQARVFDPEGRLVAQDTSVNKGPFTMVLAAPVGSDGKVWRIEITKGEIGFYEDISLSFGAEIPPFVAETPGQLIYPAGK